MEPDKESCQKLKIYAAYCSLLTRSRDTLYLFLKDMEHDDNDGSNKDHYDEDIK